MWNCHILSRSQTFQQQSSNLQDYCALSLCKINHIALFYCFICVHDLLKYFLIYGVCVWGGGGGGGVMGGEGKIKDADGKFIEVI